MYRRRRIPLPLLGALGLLLGLGAAALISLPRVTDLTPPPGSSGALAAPAVTIVFSQDMQRETVEARFAVSPERRGSFHWSDRRMTFTPEDPWAEGEDVAVTLAAGATSLRGLPMLGATRWTFSIGAARLAYLWPAGGPADIYLWSPAGGEPARLTQTLGGVIDFRPTPDGTRLVFSAWDDGATAIRVLDIAKGTTEVLHRCDPEAECRNAALSPDGTLLTYEEHAPQSGGQILARVWVKPLPGGRPALVAAEDHPTSQPTWSSRGWLGLYDHALMAYAIYDRLDPAHVAFYVPNELGDPMVWSPDGLAFVFPEMVFVPESVEAETEAPPQFYSHLRRVAAADGSAVDLSGNEGFLVEDAGPAFSPDGRWIAFSRRGLAPETWTPGRQIWRMRSDGAESLQLTDIASLNHAAVTWSPDGTRIAYMVFDQLNPTEPAVMSWRWIDRTDGGLIVVPESDPAAGGYAPAWIP